MESKDQQTVSSTSGGRVAYATLVTSDDFVVGALVLHHSLRRVQSSHPLIALVTHTVGEVAQTRLREAGIVLVPVEPIPNPHSDVHVQSWVDVGFTKLRLWELSLFSKLVYIDADCLVLENVDELFDLDLRAGEFAAAPDVFPPDKLNAGVLVLVPHAETFQLLLRNVPALGSYDGGDTGFLNAMFPDWYSSSTDHRLSFGYNALRTMQWFTQKKAAYWDSIRPLKIIHFCSSPKPWEERLRVGTLEKVWWQYHSSMSTDSQLKRTTASESLTALVTTWMTTCKEKETRLENSTALDWTTLCSSARVFDNTKLPRPLKFCCWSPDDATWLADATERFLGFTGSTREPPLVTSVPIPRRIHQIWFGGALPPRFKEWCASWRTAHPQWEYRLWTDADLKLFLEDKEKAPFQLRRPDLLTSAVTPVERSDVFRLEVLYALGGIYADVDFQCLRNFDVLVERAGLTAFACIANTGTVEVNNGLVGAATEHAAIAAVLDRMSTASSAGLPAVAKHVIERSGPGHFTRTLFSHWKQHDLVVFPSSFFFPLPNSMRQLKAAEDIQVFIAPHTFAVHRWAGSWLSSSSSPTESPTVGDSKAMEPSSRSVQHAQRVESLLKGLDARVGILSDASASASAQSPATTVEPVARAVEPQNGQTSHTAVAQVPMQAHTAPPDAILNRIAFFLNQQGQK